MSMYKEVYLMLFSRISEAMEEVDEAVVETGDSYTRKRLYEIYSILSRAQQEAERIIEEGEEEI